MADIILGTQWNAGGTGKIVDALSPSYDVVVRFQGGSDIGQTVYIDNKPHTFFHLSPCLLHGKQCVIGPSVLVDPAELLEEIQSFPKHMEEHQLLVSERSHLILFHHKLIDRLMHENCSGGFACAADKAAHIGIRMGDLFDKLMLKKKLTPLLSNALKTIRAVHGIKDDAFKRMLDTREFQAFTSEGIFFDMNKIVDYYYELGQTLKPYVHDVLHFLEHTKGNVLFEGSQGVMLDIDYGDYPHVSSTTTVGSALPGMKEHFGRRMGLVQAYCAHWHGGSLRTQITDWRAEALIAKGHESVAIPTKCGWLDLAMVRYSSRLNNLAELCVTKLDVLSAVDTVKICVGYTIDGEPITTYPLSDIRATPIYIELPVWKEDISQCKNFSSLPEAAQMYIRAIESITELPVKMISVGPKKDQVIFR